MLRKRSVQKAWREVGHGADKAQTIQQRRMRTKQARKGGVCYVHSAKVNAKRYSSKAILVKVCSVEKDAQNIGSEWRSVCSAGT